MTFSKTSRTITIVTSVVGGVLLLGVGAVAAAGAIGALASGGSPQGTQLASTAGVTDLSIQSRSSQFEVRYADVNEAELSVEGEGRYRWTLESRDGELRVESKKGFGDFCIGWCAPGNERVTLTLPQALNDGRLDADFHVTSGKLEAEGNYAGLELQVDAGSAVVHGSASDLTTTVNAGNATLELDDVRTADIEVSAGKVSAVIDGRAPESVDLEVSAGTLALSLPNTEYRVQSEVSAGTLDNQLRVSPQAKNAISATVAAGKAILTPNHS